MAIDRTELNQDSGKRFTMVVRSNIALRNTHSDSSEEFKKEDYSSTSRDSTIDEWLAGSGDAFEAGLVQCMTDSADQIARNLFHTAQLAIT